jgi:hypothetical protein
MPLIGVCDHPIRAAESITAKVHCATLWQIVHLHSTILGECIGARPSCCAFADQSAVPGTVVSKPCCLRWLLAKMAYGKQCYTLLG